MKTQETKQQHTPTPWMFEQINGGFTIATVNDDCDASKSIATTFLGLHEKISEQDKANAAFIVRAVNSHEALIEIKQRAEDLADVVRNGGNYKKAVEWFDEAVKEYNAIHS